MLHLSLLQQNRKVSGQYRGWCLSPKCLGNFFCQHVGTMLVIEPWQPPYPDPTLVKLMQRGNQHCVHSHGMCGNWPGHSSRASIHFYCCWIQWGNHHLTLFYQADEEKKLMDSKKAQISSLLKDNFSLDLLPVIGSKEVQGSNVQMAHTTSGTQVPRCWPSIHPECIFQTT